jgi:hypothetical protein
VVVGFVDVTDGAEVLVNSVLNGDAVFDVLGETVDGEAVADAAESGNEVLWDGQLLIFVPNIPTSV